jgi:hypothetical protein
MPHKSIKFEKLENYSILPIGWSKKGNAAFLLINREVWFPDSTSGIKCLIIDTVEDEALWLSPLYSVEGNSGIPNIWNENIDVISQKLSYYGIIPQNDPLYGGAVFSLIDDDYKLYSDELRQTGVNGISTVSLKIQSHLRGEKSLYKYVYSRKDKRILIDFSVLGYFKSPWENRVAVVYAEDYLEEDGKDFIELKFSGAHLTLGYRRIESNQTRLIDAVMSGQFYNCRSLLEAGVSPDTSVHTGESLLVLAAGHSNWDIVFLLLEFGADINSVDHEHRSPLHYAVLEEDIQIVKKLLEKGVDKRLSDSRGDTALSLAGKKGNSEIMALLER